MALSPLVSGTCCQRRKYDFDVGRVDRSCFIAVAVRFGIGVDFFVNVFLCICGCE